MHLVHRKVQKQSKTKYNGKASRSHQEVFGQFVEFESLINQEERQDQVKSEGSCLFTGCLPPIKYKYIRLNVSISPYILGQSKKKWGMTTSGKKPFI